jgi:glucokinase
VGGEQRRIGRDELVGQGGAKRGPVDRHGIIQNAETLPAFSGIRLAPVISERVGVPCVIDNDAAVAAIGEHAYGRAAAAPGS